MTNIYSKQLTIIDAISSTELRIRDDEGRELAYFPPLHIRHEMYRLLQDNRTLIGMVLRYEPSGVKGLPTLKIRPQ